MAVLNFGSLNIDYVYEVDHLVKPGETLDSLSFSKHRGGKGLNQSIALARAGAQVYHAGKVGDGGSFLVDYLAEAGVDTGYVGEDAGPTGHAFIQVDRSGENSIILYGGANRTIEPRYISEVLGNFSASDALLLQNEISSMPQIMEQAAARGMEIFFNPAPMNDQVLSYPLDRVTWFIVNEIEGQMLSGADKPEDITGALLGRYPKARVVLTLGSRGARYAEGSTVLDVPAYPVQPVDTTAAGDTFIGYFIASLVGGGSLADSLDAACRAAALCVTLPGAAGSIPTRAAVAAFRPGRPE